MVEILVMGGSRFIGKHLLQKLSEDEKNNILVLNRGTIESDRYLPSNAVHIKVDRNNKEEIEQALSGKKFDFVYDICAITGDHVSHLLNIIKNNVGRHIHVSTGSVYDILKEDNPMLIPINEDGEIGPISEDEPPYMLNKRSAEKELMDAFNEGYPVTIVRPTFVYGPDNYFYSEAYFFDRILEEKHLFLPSKSSGYYDLIHVDDLVDIMLSLAMAPAEVVLGEAFNGSSGTAINGYKMAKIISGIIGKEPKIMFYTPKDLIKISWPQTPQLFPYLGEGAIFLGMDKTKSLLNFEPKFNYESGLKHAYEWWSRQERKEIDWGIEDKFAKYLELKNKKNDLKKELKELKTEIRDHFNQTKSED